MSAEEEEYLRLLGELDGEPPAKDWTLDVKVANSGQRDNSWTQAVTFNKRQFVTPQGEISLNAATDSLESSGYLGLQYYSPIAEAHDWHWHLRVSDESLNIEEDAEDNISRYREAITQVETGVLWDFAAANTYIATAEAGMLWDRIEVDYDARPLFADIKQKQDLVKPYLALYYRHHTGNNSAERSIDGGLRLEKNLTSMAGDNTREYERLGRFGVEKDYRILSADLDVLWRYHPRRSSNLKFSGRSGFGDRLVPQEQSVLGGRGSIRGYPAGQVAADAYYAASLEHRWIMSSKLPLLERWALSIFAEGGWFKRTGATAVIRRGNAAAAQRIFPDDGELASVGISSSWQFKHDLELILDYGIALKPVKESEQVILIAPNRPARLDAIQRIRLDPESSVDEGDGELHLQVKMRF